ncbi:MAG: putative addiction module antidote protein [Bythopirellula sp.]|nr:putative addiction module antidote protein [Bythopirellula sp.]
MTPKQSKPKPSKSFDETRYEVLRDPQAAAIYLDKCLADGNMELFTESLRHVAKARVGGMAPLSDMTDLGRETLYRTLSKQGNPRLDTLNKVLTAVGLRLSITSDAVLVHREMEFLC